MMTISNNDSKPKGYFEHILAIDCETTGINFTSKDPSDGQQAISWGIIVADGKTLNPIEELYLEIKYNEQSKKLREQNPNFGVEASKIHGLSFSYLEEHGIEEEEAVIKIANLILKYWGPCSNIKCLGHNVQSFDIPFFKAMMKRHNVDIPIGHRHYDTNSLAYMTIGTYTSDQMFEFFGLEERNMHNALEDIRMTLYCASKIKALWKEKTGLVFYE